LRELLKKGNLEDDLIEEIEDALKALEICKNQSKSYILQVNVINNN